MSWVFAALAVTLGLILLWGVVAPRSQWRALAAWSVSDGYRHEPGGASYGLRRVVSGAGALALLVVVGATSVSGLTVQPESAPAPTRIEQMWGSPDPLVVNRVISALTAPATGLVDTPILGYQDVSAEVPEYFDRLHNFSLLGNSDIPGYVGGLPAVGNRALDYATIVVHVRGPLLCIPRAVTVIQSAETIQIAVYYGLPTGAPNAADVATACATDQPVTGSLLIPVRLSAPVDGRAVQSLSGSTIGAVAVPARSRLCARGCAPRAVNFAP